MVAWICLRGHGLNAGRVVEHALRLVFRSAARLTKRTFFTSLTLGAPIPYFQQRSSRGDKEFGVTSRDRARSSSRAKKRSERVAPAMP